MLTTRSLYIKIKAYRPNIIIIDLITLTITVVNSLVFFSGLLKVGDLSLPIGRSLWHATHFNWYDHTTERFTIGD